MLEENTQCSISRIWLQPGQQGTLNSNTTLEECFELAMINDDCAENVVEWGHNFVFDPNSTGYCLCYKELCTPDLYEKENGEHLIRFNQLVTVSSGISNKNIDILIFH